MMIVRKLIMPEELFVKFLQVFKKGTKTFEVQENPLPDDAKIINTALNRTTRSITFSITSDEFIIDQPTLITPPMVICHDL